MKSTLSKSSLYVHQINNLNFNYLSSFSLTNDEIFIGTVIFRLLNVMPCNSHDISEFDSPVSDYFAPGAQKVSIGAGLYPCLGDFI